MAVGAILLGAALIGGLVLLFAGGGDDSSNSKASPRTSQLQDKFLKHTVVETDKGISVRRPGNWSDSNSHGVVTLRSHDRCLAMTLAAPVPAGQAKSLRSDSVGLLRRSYKNARVAAAPSSDVGGIPTTSNTLSFRDQKGNQIRVLLSVGTGQKNAYLTEVVVRNPSCAGDLALGQVVLSSIQYTK